LPAKELGSFVRALAHPIAKFPAAGVVTVKDRVNTIALAPVEDFRRDPISSAKARTIRKPKRDSKRR
jgi:hypothetical protein